MFSHACSFFLFQHPDIYQRAVLRNPCKNAFTSKVDLWSLGVTLFHVATGQLPFKPYGGRKNRDKMYAVLLPKPHLHFMSKWGFQGNLQIFHTLLSKFLHSFEMADMKIG